MSAAVCRTIRFFLSRGWTLDRYLVLGEIGLEGRYGGFLGGLYGGFLSVGHRVCSSKKCVYTEV